MPFYAQPKTTQSKSWLAKAKDVVLQIDQLQAGGFPLCFDIISCHDEERPEAAFNSLPSHQTPVAELVAFHQAWYNDQKLRQRKFPHQRRHQVLLITRLDASDKRHLCCSLNLDLSDPLGPAQTGEVGTIWRADEIKSLTVKVHQRDWKVAKAVSYIGLCLMLAAKDTKARVQLASVAGVHLAMSLGVLPTNLGEAEIQRLASTRQKVEIPNLQQLVLNMEGAS
jgi:hypothetical protein